MSDTAYAVLMVTGGFILGLVLDWILKGWLKNVHKHGDQLNKKEILK